MPGTQGRAVSYGDGNCIMLLAAEAMGLAPGWIDAARQSLEGRPIHPTAAAAIEQEAVRVNDLVRHAGRLAEANMQAERLKVKYGFGASVLTVTTVAGKTYGLGPVPMAEKPSADPALWLAFQSRHLAGALLSDEAQNALQRFMRAHNTEALTDGESFYTLAGGMLAACDPLAQAKRECVTT